MPDISPIYRPRNPQNSAYYRCVEDHFESFEQAYEERFERQYGFFRPYVKRSFTGILTVVIPIEDQLYKDPDYPIETYAS